MARGEGLARDAQAAPITLQVVFHKLHHSCQRGVNGCGGGGWGEVGNLKAVAEVVDMVSTFGHSPSCGF